ncbi:hypothetical protein NDU88_001870 [Pleurodeles waltl]|uniref:Uncharacterized protein n=1 Tax=Pleurodeles waltl TaxID=8319 RepID=A0AAV7P8D0_PLEWA|nr:hypothetical protein NDU88_001870 [Pleurodeles waltl]
MGAQVRFAHARMGKRRQARSPLERGDELNISTLEERTLGGVSNMAAPSVDSRPISALEERKLGTPVKMSAPVFNVEDEVVVIYDDDEEVQADSGEGPSGYDTSHASSGHGVQASHQQSGRMVGEQSLPVKVRVSSERRPEGRVKPRAVYPNSREMAGVRPLGPLIDSDDARLSTSQGAGVGWTSMDEDLLDYEDDMEEPVMSLQWVMMAGGMPGVVQGGHSKVHRRDMVAGNLPRGTVRRSGGLDVISRRQGDAVRFVMQQIEAGLAAVNISVVWLQ